MKNFIVDIELETVELHVKAKTQSEARKKAIAKLNRKKTSSYIDKRWPSNRKKIWIDEIS